jgi:hypothetical protein
MEHIPKTDFIEFIENLRLSSKNQPGGTGKTSGETAQKQ